MFCFGQEGVIQYIKIISFKIFFVLNSNRFKNDKTVA